MEDVAVRLASYLTDGSLVAPRNLQLPPSRLDFLPLALSIALLALGAWRGPKRRELLAWAAVALVTFGFVAASATADGLTTSRFRCCRS